LVPSSIATAALFAVGAGTGGAAECSGANLWYPGMQRTVRRWRKVVNVRSTVP